MKVSILRKIDEFVYIVRRFSPCRKTQAALEYKKRWFYVLKMLYLLSGNNLHPRRP